MVSSRRSARKSVPSKNSDDSVADGNSEVNDFSLERAEIVNRMRDTVLKFKTQVLAEIRLIREQIHTDFLKKSTNNLQSNIPTPAVNNNLQSISHYPATTSTVNNSNSNSNSNSNALGMNQVQTTTPGHVPLPQHSTQAQISAQQLQQQQLLRQQQMQMQHQHVAPPSTLNSSAPSSLATSSVDMDAYNRNNMNMNMQQQQTGVYPMNPALTNAAARGSSKRTYDESASMQHQQQQQQQIQQQQQNIAPVNMNTNMMTTDATQALASGSPKAQDQKPPTLPKAAKFSHTQGPGSRVSGKETGEDSMEYQLRRRAIFNTKLRILQNKRIAETKGTPNLMNRLKSHWDYVLDEAQWMAIDYRQERRWKLKEMSSIAAQCSHKVSIVNQKEGIISSNAILSEDKEKRIDRANLISTIVDNHWKSYLEDLSNECVRQNVVTNHGHRVDAENEDQLGNKLETDFQIMDTWNTTIDIAITNAKAVLKKEQSSSSSKKKDDYDGLINDLFAEQKTLFEKVTCLNKKNIGAIVYGPSYQGKTFVMATIIKHWLKLASQLEMRAADGCNHAVLIMCSQDSIYKWQHQLQRCAQDYKCLVWGHHWDPHSYNSNNDNEEDIVHYGDADIVICAIESFVSSAGGNTSDNGEPKTLVKGKRLVDLRPWTGVMIDFRGLEEESQWHYRKEFFDGQIEPSSNDGIASKYSPWERFRWLPNLVQCLKQTCTQRCIVSDYSLLDSDMTKNSTMTYSTEKETTAAIISFCMPVAFDYNFEHALRWLKCCENYKDSDTSIYTKPFEALLALELLLHLEESDNDGRNIVEEMISLDMDFPQSRTYYCMLNCLMAQQVFAGDDIRLMAQACMLLQRLCFHEGLVCSARLGVYNMDNMAGRPSTNFMRNHAARLSSTDLLSLDRFRIISSANQFIYRSLYQLSYTITNTATSSPKFSNGNNNNAVVGADEVSRPLSPLKRFAPGFNRGNLNCTNNFLFSNRRLRSKGSCKLRALKGILELYVEDRIVIVVDTINEEQLLHQHLDEEGIPHLHSVTYQLDGSGDLFYRSFNHFSWQHKIVSFNQDLNKPCIMICRFDTLYQHGCLPYNADIFLVLSQNWARKSSLKEMFKASYRPFPKMKDVKIISVVVKGSMEEAMITAGGSIKDLQGRSITNLASDDGVVDPKLANTTCICRNNGSDNGKGLVMEVDKETEVAVADIQANALKILSLWKCSQTTSCDNAATSTATSAGGMGKGKGIIVRDSTGSAMSIASNHSRGGGSSNQPAWQQWLDALSYGIRVSEFHFERTARGGLFVVPYQMNTAHGLNLETMASGNNKELNKKLNLLEFIPPREEGDELTTVNGSYTGNIFNHSCYHRENISTFGFGLKNTCGLVAWKKRCYLELQTNYDEMKVHDLDNNEFYVANISEKLFEKSWNKVNASGVELLHHNLRHRSNESDTLLRCIHKFEVGHNTFVKRPHTATTAAGALEVAASTDSNEAVDEHSLTLIPGIDPQDTPFLWPQAASRKIPLPMTSFESFRSTTRSLRRDGIAVDSILHVHPLQNASRYDISTVQSWQQNAGDRNINVMIKFWKGHGTSEPSRKASKIQSRVEQKKRSLDIPLQIDLGARSMEFNAGYGNSSTLFTRHGYNYSVKPIFTSRRIPRGVKEPNIRQEPWTQDEEAFILAMLNIYGEQSWRLIEYLLNQRPQAWGKVRSLRQIRDRHRRIDNTEDIKCRSAFTANDMTQYFTSENDNSITSNTDELNHWLHSQTDDPSVYENKFIHKFITAASENARDSIGKSDQNTDVATTSPSSSSAVATGITMDVAEVTTSDGTGGGGTIGQEKQLLTAPVSNNTLVTTSPSARTPQEEPHSVISTSTGVNILAANSRSLNIFEQRKTALVTSFEARPNFPFHAAYPRVLDSDQMGIHDSHKMIINNKQINGSLKAYDILSKLKY